MSVRVCVCWSVCCSKYTLPTLHIIHSCWISTWKLTYEMCSYTHPTHSHTHLTHSHTRTHILVSGSRQRHPGKWRLLCLRLLRWQHFAVTCIKNYVYDFSSQIVQTMSDDAKVDHVSHSANWRSKAKSIKMSEMLEWRQSFISMLWGRKMLPLVHICI